VLHPVEKTQLLFDFGLVDVYRNGFTNLQIQIKSFFFIKISSVDSGFVRYLDLYSEGSHTWKLKEEYLF